MNNILRNLLIVILLLSIIVYHAYKSSTKEGFKLRQLTGLINNGKRKFRHKKTKVLTDTFRNISRFI